MKNFAKFAAAGALTIGFSAIAAPAFADCNNDTGTETALGAGSGALVGGLASHSWGGAIIGGVAGGLIGNSIGNANNAADCRAQARAYYRERAEAEGYGPPRDIMRHHRRRLMARRRRPMALRRRLTALRRPTRVNIPTIEFALEGVNRRTARRSDAAGFSCPLCHFAPGPMTLAIKWGFCDRLG